MPKYMLLLHSVERPDLSPTEMQHIVGEYVAWARELHAQGKMLGGDELSSASKRITGTGADLRVTDGPFTETREAIGGYFLIEAADEAEAVAIASRCPGLKRGTTIQMNEIIEH